MDIVPKQRVLSLRVAQYVPDNLYKSHLNDKLPVLFFLLAELNIVDVALLGSHEDYFIVSILDQFFRAQNSQVRKADILPAHRVLWCANFEEAERFLSKSNAGVLLDLSTNLQVVEKLLNDRLPICTCFLGSLNDLSVEKRDNVVHLCGVTIWPGGNRVLKTNDHLEEFLKILGERLVLRSQLGSLDDVLERKTSDRSSAEYQVLFSMIKGGSGMMDLQAINSKIDQLEGLVRGLSGVCEQMVSNVTKVTASLDTLNNSLPSTGEHCLDRHHIKENDYTDEIALIKASNVFDHQFYRGSNRDLNDANIDLIEHYVQFGHKEGRNPHPLFFNDYYRASQQQAGVGSSGMITPLGDCLVRHGKDGLSPHPLFDVQYYLSQVDQSDVIEEKKDVNRFAPWLHYIQVGAAFALSPHEQFNASYYIRSVPDFNCHALDPLSHYLVYGSQAGIKPNRHFNPNVYRSRYSDIAATGIEPLMHYVQYGQCEGRSGEAVEIVDYNLYLPVQRSTDRLLTSFDRPVNVIVPVYGNLDCVKRCLESALSAVNYIRYKIVVVEDCSKEPDVLVYLRELAKAGKIDLLENDQNMGFVRSVNLGMTYDRQCDVVLLNSDTVVPKGWLDNLVRHAYVDDKIATVCPFSNNATLCNFPTFDGFNDYPGLEGVQELHDACFLANYGRGVEIPTAVGSCMFIKRECLTEIGLFCADTWGAGYGEECDFSLRATKGKWRHILATDTFVFHEGEKSFGASAVKRKQEASLIMAQKHPEYNALCNRFFASDPVKPFRCAAMASYLKNNSKDVTLYIEHNLGGGVKKAIELELQESNDCEHVIFLRPVYDYGNEYDLELVSVSDDLPFQIILRSQHDLDFIVRFLRSIGVDYIKIHHLLGVNVDVKKIIEGLNVPFELTVHDYYYACPRVTLFNTKGEYCREPDIEGCNTCLSVAPFGHSLDIVWWRLQFNWLFRQAQKVFAPSEDCANRIRKYFSYREIIVKPHERLKYKQKLNILQVSNLDTRKELRVAILGVLALHKGASLVNDVLGLVKQKGLKVKIKLIGSVEPGLFASFSEFIEQTGGYKESELVELINDFDPHVFWFPSLCPETYSFTLSTALSYSKPILASEFGAFTERLQDREWSWLYPVTSDCYKVIDYFQHVRQCLEEGSYSKLALNDMAGLVGEDRASVFSSININRGAKPRLMVIPELLAGVPSPCAYIRGLLPLSHRSVEDFFDVFVGGVDEIRSYKPDVVFTHRVAIKTIRQYEELKRSTSHGAIPIVFDLDDNLLSVPDNHPDYEVYLDRAEIIQSILGMCSEVWVSTNALINPIQEYCGRITLVPNYLDERIWFNGVAARRPGGEWNVNKKVKILYMGTRTHDHDFEMVKPAFRELYRKWHGHFEVDVIGAVNGGNTEPWYKLDPVPYWYNVGTYPAFVNWLKSVNDYQIGISPLCDSVFNRSKSAIKFLDYSALGLVSVVSKVLPYLDGSIVNQKNGLIVPNSTESWFEALDFLLASEVERGVLRWAAFTNVITLHTLRSNNYKRADSLLGLIGQHSPRDVPFPPGVIAA
jgi:GT2 family glycosyltransferase